MQLQELQEQARKILALQSDNSDYELVSFRTYSGGIPRNKCKVETQRDSETFEYETQMCGDAYSAESIIMCRDTGTVDSNERNIYQTPSGQVFVFIYTPGSPSSFDSGIFDDPTFQ
jgi:hypothetical protein